MDEKTEGFHGAISHQAIISMKIESRYLDQSYLAKNPDWDRQDAPWKASKVLNLLTEHKISGFNRRS